LTYARGTETLCVQNINILLVFKRQILRKLFWPKQCREGWRIGSNNKLQHLKRIRYCKIYKSKKNKLREGGENHKRMEDIKLVKRFMDWNNIEVNTKGWPNNRWRDEEINDLKKLKLRNWSKDVKDGIAWNDVVQKTNKPCNDFLIKIQLMHSL